MKAWSWFLYSQTRQSSREIHVVNLRFYCKEVTNKVERRPPAFPYILREFLHLSVKRKAMKFFSTFHAIAPKSFIVGLDVDPSSAFKLRFK